MYYQRVSNKDFEQNIKGKLPFGGWVLINEPTIRHLGVKPGDVIVNKYRTIYFRVKG